MKETNIIDDFEKNDKKHLLSSNQLEDPRTQHKIFRTLFENNFNIISFSVPKATLLEYLFINYTDEVREENE